MQEKINFPKYKLILSHWHQIYWFFSFLIKLSLMQNFKHRFPWDFVLSCQIFETSILVPKTLEEVEKKILRGSTIPDNILTWSTKVNSCSHFQEKTAFKICGIHRKIQGPELKGRYEGRTSGSTAHANINRVWGCPEDHFLHINSRGIVDWHSSPFGCIQIELKLRVCVSIIQATILKRCSNQMPSSLLSAKSITVFSAVYRKLSASLILNLVSTWILYLHWLTMFHDSIVWYPCKPCAFISVVICPSTVNADKFCIQNQISHRFRAN